MANHMNRITKFLLGIVIAVDRNSFSGCKKPSIRQTLVRVPALVPVVRQHLISIPLMIPMHAIAPFANYQQWGPYNVHDPSIIKNGD